MSYTDVFGGELLFPSQLSYLAITTAVDVTLQWPTEQQITGGNVVADVMDIDATAGGLNIDMPDARNTSTGNKATFNNVGSNVFTVRDNTGGTIQSVQPGEQWVVVLTDNSTQAGLWSTFQLGGNAATQASASALAGAGLRANGQMLDQIIDSDVEASTPITVVDGDRAKCLIYTGGAGQADLPSAGTVGNNWFFMLRNSGSGTLNIVPPSGNIDGSSNINLDPNSSTFIFTDGTDYFTIGLTAASTIAFDFVSIPIPGSGDFVLSGANLNRIAYRFTGALTGDRKVVVPDTTQQYWCDNQTTGAFVLSIGTNAQGSPPTLDPGTTAIFYANAVEVIDAVNAVSVSFPILISQGGTGATNAADARTNLDVPQTADVVPVTRLVDSGAGMTGGGALSGDLTLDIGQGDGIAVNADDIEVDIPSLTQAAEFNYDNDDFMIFDSSAGALRKVRGNVFASRMVMLASPVVISTGGDDVWTTITDASLTGPDASIAIIRGWAQIAPTASAFAQQVMHLRETGSAIAKATSNRFVAASAEDSGGLGASSDTNDAFVSLNANNQFDILQDQVGVGTQAHQAWIIGYVIN